MAGTVLLSQNQTVLLGQNWMVLLGQNWMVLLVWNWMVLLGWTQMVLQGWTWMVLLGQNLMVLLGWKWPVLLIRTRQHGWFGPGWCYRVGTGAPGWNTWSCLGRPGAVRSILRGWLRARAGCVVQAEPCPAGVGQRRCACHGRTHLCLARTLLHGLERWTAAGLSRGSGDLVLPLPGAARCPAERGLARGCPVDALLKLSLPLFSLPPQDPGFASQALISKKLNDYRKVSPAGTKPDSSPKGPRGLGIRAEFLKQAGTSAPRSPRQDAAVTKDESSSQKAPWGINIMKKNKKSAPRAFGVRLEDCQPAPDNKNVPLIVEACCKVVEDRGLEYMGIYRVPGNNAVVSSLQEQLNKGATEINLQDERWQDLNVISSLLKSFFRKLPEPLFTDDKYNDFIEANRIEDASERMRTLRKLVGTWDRGWGGDTALEPPSGGDSEQRGDPTCPHRSGTCQATTTRRSSSWWGT
uniref:Rho-GAP domain-containing protein n=1 Tax=Serinus canaria TaxID=9135 RepID=A0A8C9MVX5_SERCA